MISQFEDLSRRMEYIRKLLEKKKWQKEAKQKELFALLKVSTSEEAKIAIKQLKLNMDKVGISLQRFKDEFEKCASELNKKGLL